MLRSGRALCPSAAGIRQLGTSSNRKLGADGIRVVPSRVVNFLYEDAGHGDKESNINVQLNSINVIPLEFRKAMGLYETSKASTGEDTLLANVKELKKRLKAKGLRQSGRKAELIKRLIQAEEATTSAISQMAVEGEDSLLANVKELKKRLKAKGLTQSGRKAELIKRLIQAEEATTSAKSQMAVEGEDSLLANVKELKKRLKAKGLRLSGRKAELIKRLIQAEEAEAAAEGVVDEEEKD